MALIKTRPNVRLLLQRPLVAGALAEFIVELECPAQVPVDAVSLTLTGEVVWFTSSQHGRHRNASRFLSLDVPLLARETVLEAGTHELRTRVSLSTDLPGSWQGDRLAIEYGVKVHVDIPWWPDKRVAFVVPVASAPEAFPAGARERATVFVSHAGGPPARGPYLELSLDRRTAAPGTPLRMSAALGNVERNRYRKLHVSLIARESFPLGLGTSSEIHDHPLSRWSVDVEGHPGELQPIPFTLTLPNGLTPAFKLHGCELRWLIQAQADVAWGSDPTLRVPLEITPAATELPDAPHSASLAVGSDRLRLIWAKVAESTPLSFAGDRLRGRVEHLGVELYRAEAGGRTRVLARFDFPALGIDLHVVHERRGLLGGSTAELRTRDPGQRAALQATLEGPEGLGQLELLDASESHLEFSTRASGLELDPLIELAQEVFELGQRLAALELPVPAALAAHSAQWRAAARRLGARVRPGDLRLELRREQLQVLLGSIFGGEGELRGFALELRAGLQIPSRLHLDWNDETGLPDHELKLAPLLEAPAPLALSIDSDRLRLSSAEPLTDPKRARDWIEALFGIGAQLHGERGPYR